MRYYILNSSGLSRSGEEEYESYAEEFGEETCDSVSTVMAECDTTLIRIED